MALSDGVGDCGCVLVVRRAEDPVVGVVPPAAAVAVCDDIAVSSLLILVDMSATVYG